MSTQTLGSLATAPLEDLVAEKEQIEEDAAAERRAAVERARLRTARLVAIESHLVRRLGPGEAVQAPSGRVLFRDEGREGSAKVDTTALYEHAPRLPEHLRPRMVEQLPTVTAIRDAARKRELPEGVRAGDLLIEGERVPRLRWRTLTDDAA